MEGSVIVKTGECSRSERVTTVCHGNMAIMKAQTVGPFFSIRTK